jgi:hypothetical protein
VKDGMIHLKGTPLLLDVMLRPVVRGAQLVVAALLTAAVIMLEWWAVLPLPLAFSFVAYELFFWWRGDRAVRVRLGQALNFVDPVRGQRRVILPADIYTAKLHFRRSEVEGYAICVVLADREGVLFAAQLDEVAHFEPQRWDIDADTTDAVLGGYGGMVRALAPQQSVCRQVVRDTRGQLVQWLREQLPPEVWERTSLRLWRGEAPDLDLFGYHTGEPDAWCVLEADRIRVTRDGGEVLEARLSQSDCWTSERQAVLFRPGGDRALDPQLIPLLVVATEDFQLAIPAPIVGASAPAKPATSDFFHAHVPDGAAALWHLWQRIDAVEWPALLRQAVLDSRVATGGLPPSLSARLGAVVEGETDA